MAEQSLGSIISVFGTVCLVLVLLISFWQPLPQFNPPAILPQKDVDAKIVNFAVIDWGSLPCIVGVIVAIQFNVTVENRGSENLTGLTVHLKILSNDTATPLEGCWYSNYNLTINSGQTVSTEIDFFIDFVNAWTMRDSHQNFSATLIAADGAVLDECRLFQ